MKFKNKKVLGLTLTLEKIFFKKSQRDQSNLNGLFSVESNWWLCYFDINKSYHTFKITNWHNIIY